MSDRPFPLPGSDCEHSRRLVLDSAWSAADRQRIAAALEHIQSCDECKSAVTDFDQLRSLLMPVDVANEAVENNSDDRTIRQIHAHPHRSSPFKFGVRMTAVASILILIASGSFWIGRNFLTQRGEGVDHSTDPAVLASAHFAPAELVNRVTEFEKVSEAFDGKATWFVDSNSNSDSDPNLGLASAPTSERDVLLIRLTVLGPDLQTGVKKPVSSADLAILPGHKAKLSLPFPDGRTLSYDILAGTEDPMRLAIYAELMGPKSSSAHESLAAIATTLSLQSGSAASAGSFTSSAGQYDLTVGFSRQPLSRGMQ